jgi:hypothetical protein
MVRDAVLAVALVFVAVLGYLTLRVLLSEGFDVLVGMSLLVLALLGFGVLGALTSRDDR